MSDAQQRAAEVIAGVIDRKHGAIAEGDYYATAEHIAAALGAAGLLVDDDTARLVNLGRAFRSKLDDEMAALRRRIAELEADYGEGSIPVYVLEGRHFGLAMARMWFDEATERGP